RSLTPSAPLPGTCVPTSPTMAAFSSPVRLMPPMTPRRAPSPVMSPGGRRMRSQMGSEESHLRELSPETTLRAFTEQPAPFDTTREEYKMFACIENLTVAERDLGARVARAAQRLKSWCDEIEQWGWSGSFEQPSDEYREQRRQSIESRIKEHVKDDSAVERMPELEYWGSLLSVEVESHEARLDEIGDELLSLDVDELKEHVLDMHPSSRSRPSSSGYGGGQRDYTPVDDFSFLITQTLLSALPHHFQIKDKLSTWTARVAILRGAPRYIDDLRTAQKAMRLGWDAIEPPTDTSDTAFDKWKEAVNTISKVLQGKVSDLGRRLDRMLDTLEGREDCLPDDWIDNFESIEADFGKWVHESTKRVIEFDVRRRGGYKALEARDGAPSERLSAHSGNRVTTIPDSRQQTLGPADGLQLESIPESDSCEPGSAAAAQGINPGLSVQLSRVPEDPAAETDAPTEDESVFDEGDTLGTVVHNDIEDVLPARPKVDGFVDSPLIIATDEQNTETSVVVDRPHTPISRRESSDSISSDASFSSSPPSVIEESPSMRNTTNRNVRAPRPALNAAMSKRRGPKTAAEPDMANVPWPPTQFAQKSSSSSDELERKISDILTTIPAHIRLTSGIGSEAREVKSRGLASKSSKGYLRTTRSFSGMKSPELTLSPARQDDSANASSGRRSAAALRGDNDIKLYHLTQPGREHPIKLFIRRVGENGERVMVRVGGGWADLGEYLRQYAEHHGRRTVSEGKFELLGLEVADTSPNRPGSSIGKRDRRVSGETTTGSPNTTPVKSAAVGLLKDDQPPPPPMSDLSSTPGLTGEDSSPPSGDSKRSWKGTEVGLAGPKAKKLELSGEKQEWIEGMMKQARSVSGPLTLPRLDQRHRPESRSGSRSASRSASRAVARRQQSFGDLGKVGGTKRIYMRGGGGTAYSEQH
ncbi:hypothetical protein BS50DRAFT_490374, partial [Corynespora cassiicola Philippines]